MLKSEVNFSTFFILNFLITCKLKFVRISISIKTLYFTMKLKIINESTYLPPLAIWHINKSLQWIPPLDLVGIDHILLVDKVTEINTGSPKKDKELCDKMSKPSGFYYMKTQSNPAFIRLIISNLFYPIPYYANYSPFPTLHIAKALAHEVGHHLVATKGYIFAPDEKYPSYEKKPEIEEEMADRYAFQIVSKMKEKLTYRAGTYIMEIFALYHHSFAMDAWKVKNYKASAECWSKAYLLDTEKQEYLDWYWQSREKIESNQKSKQSD